MTMRVILPLACSLAMPAYAFGAPPVQVEVIEEDEADDFFEDEDHRAVDEEPIDVSTSEPTRKKKQPPRVAETGAGGEGAPFEDDEDEDDDSWWESRHERNWWRAPRRVREGDLLLFLSGGGSSAGAFFGLGMEAMATDVVGIRLAVRGTGFDARESDGGERRSLDFFSPGKWGNQGGIDAGRVEDGFAHLTDLAVTFHMKRSRRFDFYPAIGVSHFGYDVEYPDDHERGGSGYLRLGAAFNFHMGKRFFAGADFGWYPLELFRYRIVDVPFRRRDEADFEAIDDHWVPSRIVLSFHGGFRF